jgi:hypothetical protein
VPVLWLASGMPSLEGLSRSCAAWLGSLALAGAIIQAVPGLRFVGEGFRYFEFAIVPLAVIASQAIASLPQTAFLALLPILAIAAALAVFQIARNARASWNEGVCRDDRAVTLARRVSLSGQKRLLVMPLQYAPLVTVEARASTLMMLGEVGADRSEDFYPVMEKSPAHFVQTFLIDGLFLDRRYAGIEELALADVALVDEEGPFAVYRITNPGAGSGRLIPPPAATLRPASTP